MSAGAGLSGGKARGQGGFGAARAEPAGPPRGREIRARARRAGQPSRAADLVSDPLFQAKKLRQGGAGGDQLGEGPPIEDGQKRA